MSTRLTPPATFLVIGHRGSPKRFPENTVASFEDALRGGADGFETDLRLLADGTAILFHDDELEGRTIEALSASDVEAAGARIEPLAALGRFAGSTTMVLEVKRGGWEDALVEHVSDWSGIVVASFDHVMIASLARRGVPFPLGITTNDRLANVDDYASRIGASWLFPNHRYVDPGDVARLKARDIRVVPWTVNRERDWIRFLQCGCDGVITDHPTDAVAWRKRMTNPTQETRSEKEETDGRSRR